MPLHIPSIELYSDSDCMYGNKCFWRILYGNSILYATAVFTAATVLKIDKVLSYFSLLLTVVILEVKDVRIRVLVYYYEYESH